jgi:hypothetical protein
MMSSFQTLIIGHLPNTTGLLHLLIVTLVSAMIKIPTTASMTGNIINIMSWMNKLMANGCGSNTYLDLVFSMRTVLLTTKT